MDAVLLARLQFALTVGFHFIFPPISIGLAWFVCLLMSKYKSTGDILYRSMAKFWIKILTITFGIGVATGITMEFQFGTNWAHYSRFVGDIFGAPLAAEGIFAFFLESSFIAVLIFGWKKFSTKTLWFASLMVAVGSTLSAFWIIVANSWMQTPAGFHIANGRAELTNFFQAVFNISTLPRFFHTVDACLISGAFVVMGISAWHLLKNSNLEPAKKALKISLIVALITGGLQLGIGHAHAIQVAFTQPEKLASIEGLFDTQKQAPALIFGIPDREAKTVHAAIRVPGLLSLLAFGKLDAEVKGMNDFPQDELPPLALTFYPFHLMVMLGMLFIGLPLLGLFLLYRKRLFENRSFLFLTFLATPLPIIANELGWITAEVGRQPWAIYKILKTSDAISLSVPAGQILASIIIFSTIYVVLFAAWFFLIKQQVAKGYETEVAK